MRKTQNFGGLEGCGLSEILSVIEETRPRLNPKKGIPPLTLFPKSVSQKNNSCTTGIVSVG